MTVTWWIPSRGHDYFVPFFFFGVLVSRHHSSSLSTNRDGPSSEQRIALEQVSLLAEDGRFLYGGRGKSLVHAT